MNYVMEVGPLLGGTWMLFCVDEERQVHLCAAKDREAALEDIVEHLAGAPAFCCSSLRTFGAEHRWTRREPPHMVLEIAAVTAISLEHLPCFGAMPPPPLVDAWLRTCEMFLSVSPWKRFARSRFLDAHFDGLIRGRKAVGVLHGQTQPGLLLVDEPLAVLDEGTSGFPKDCLVLGLSSTMSPAAEAISRVYGRTFAPRMMRYRGGHESMVTEEDLRMLIGTLGGIASLCSGREVGRSNVEGLETIVLPYDQTAPNKKLAS